MMMFSLDHPWFLQMLLIHVVLLIVKNEYAKTHVGIGATIGANATIVCGHNIGKFAFIGAGAVVTKHVPAYALLVGNPARQIGWMSENGHRLQFNENNIATCPESTHQYRLDSNTVVRIV
jgi:UDP-2-acetamido-3-amino-2,3-dideoxy-glucuronate N-acetyltransferase